MTKKVLTIDDSKTLRMIVGKHLSPFGVQMLEAENGEQGIKRARETSPDVILLDYNMPVMDGYHTLIELKADEALKDIPVVMLTTETVKETVIKLVKLGLKDYIAKPFTRDVLVNKLDPILHLFEGNGSVAAQPDDKSAAESREGQKPTILAVDDKHNILDLLKEYLSETFTVVTLDSGKAALDYMGKNRFDYMFLDLSMPDMSGLAVLDQYLQSKRDNADVRKVVAMTLRTAQSDIDKALKAGISAFLYKPFSREDTSRAVDQLLAQQRGQRKLRFLIEKGDIRILECPPEKSSRFRVVAGALSTEVIQEIDDMAEEGFNQLVIKIGEGFLSDLNVTRKFVNMVDHILQLSLKVRFVAESEQAREALKQFEETARIPMDTSLEFALNSM
ncbi:MAG: response regulator [Acidobacteria bacterium]|nr:response regulator [Acidobacteriota bacterium]